MSRLTNKLMRSGYLRTSSIIEAFANIERVEFVPGAIELGANSDVPLPIG